MYQLYNTVCFFFCIFLVFKGKCSSFNVLWFIFYLGALEGGIEDIKKHQFFSNISWDKLEKRQVTPPFKPVVNRVDDAFYFDTEFTSRTPKGKIPV